jgi:hypothetical protein
MFSKSDKHNPNYLASIVKLSNVRKHTGADRLQCVAIMGNNVITGLDAKDGDLYCFFPLECAISSDFLTFTNSFREKDLNADKTKSAYFEYHGRVRCVKFRGERSEGYIVPVSVIESFIKGVLKLDYKITEKDVGADFDTIKDHQLCKKYIPKGFREPGTAGKKTRGNVKRYESKLVENQFHFHPSTEQLKRNVDKLSPSDYIAVTEKYHGTSFVVANVIVKKKLSIKDRVMKFFGGNVIETEYGMLYSSRSVLKNVAMDDDKQNNHFYDSDVWKIVAEKIFPSLKKGYSAYGEIVGYTPTGGAIQRDYDYGCSPGCLDYLVYRMTYTNADGDVFELSPSQMVEYCNKFGIKTPLLHFYGRAVDMYPELSINEHWHENFLNNLICDYLEKDCLFCKSKPNIPGEGIILRVDKPDTWEVYKLKSFRFVMQESTDLDRGILDIETAESSEES